MIGFLAGTVLEKREEHVTLRVGDVGYVVQVTPTTLARLPIEGAETELWIEESVGVYGGVTLYGFLARDERDLFDAIRTHVPKTGAKKAIEFLEKGSKSLPDFRRALIERDLGVLGAMFGFTHKTAEKLASSLKDKLGPAKGGKRGPVEAGIDAMPGGAALTQALAALGSLGYKAMESKNALRAVQEDLNFEARPVEELIRLALKKL